MPVTNTTPVNYISLRGTWHYQRVAGPEAGPATVPGDIYGDLLASGQIPDPFFRDNEENLQWIGQSDWVFRRSIVVPETILQHDRVLLRCEGLDTLARIVINGKTIARTDNMFRSWEWDVKDVLKVGENAMEITFESAVRHCNEVATQRGISTRMYPNKIYAAIPGLMRKQPCNFGWDWGIKAVTCGIWRDIGIVAFNTARFADVAIEQDHSTPGQVRLRLAAEIEAVHDANLRVRASAVFEGNTVAVQERPAEDCSAAIGLTIQDPKLWWPNGLGGQSLYSVAAELLHEDGTVLDSRTVRIGLRTLRLDRRPDAWGESFQFVINGVPFFAKGANWIPADAIQSRMSPLRYRALVEDAAAANMNMLRVWGGGIYEDDSFYDACDELGICIWQEFMFGGGTSPVDDADFRQNVVAEASDQLKRLRHHPCIALWCGNNEMEMGHIQESTDGPMKMSWSAYSELFDRMLPATVARMHPGCDYWPSSPHSPNGDREDFNNPTCGDAHLWAVWHEGKPFEWYRTCNHRFNSEFGFQSLPEPKTVYGFTRQDDRNIVSYVIEQHQRSHGNPRIMEYMLSWFRAPSGFDNTLWLSQILQGMSIKYAVEHWRRMMPRGMGTLYWQLNDCWPVASWSSIDFHGRWKALHYMARHFFAPLLISGVEDVAAETVAVHVTSDLHEPVACTARWQVTDVDGVALEAGTVNFVSPARSTQVVETLRLAELVRVHEKRGLFVWLDLLASDRRVSRNLVFFSRPVRRPRIFSPRPKHLDLSRSPGIKTHVRSIDGKTFDVTLTADRPALWTWLELREMDAKLSDNFFHLRPGEPVTVRLAVCAPISVDQVTAQLLVRSLVDTYG